MDENELISVIVPVYNVEKYIKKCINSIITQSYNNIEIILVDDGSTDSSGKICDLYKKLDNRIIVVHKINGGLSSARNEGLNIAKGKLISFVDSDDYIEKDFLKELKDNMRKYNSDISICNINYIKDGKKIIKNKYLIDDFYVSGKDKFNTIFNEYDSISVYAWNKLYKIELFNNVRFPYGKIYEYSYILCNLLDESNIVSYTSKTLYNYVYREESIGNRFGINHFNKIDSNNRKIEFFRKKGYDDLLVKEKNNKINNIIINLSKMKKNKIKDKEVFNKYYKELLDTNKEVKWKDANKKAKLFKIFRRPYISVLAIMYRVKDLIKK